MSKSAQATDGRGDHRAGRNGCGLVGRDLSLRESVENLEDEHVDSYK